MFPTDLLIVENWIKKQIIPEDNVNNTSKQWFSKFPGFEEKSFPFLVCSGKESFNLINVDLGLSQELIQATGNNHYG